MLGSVSILGRFDFVAKDERQREGECNYHYLDSPSKKRSMSLNVYWHQQTQYFLSISEGLKWNKILQSWTQGLIIAFLGNKFMQYYQCLRTCFAVSVVWCDWYGKHLLYETQLHIDYITVGASNLCRLFCFIKKIGQHTHNVFICHTR